MIRAGAGFRGGALSLTERGTWAMAIRYRDVEAGEVTFEDHGDYDREGEELYFRSWPYGDEFDGTIGDGAVVITYDFDGDGEYESHFTFVE